MKKIRYMEDAIKGDELIVEIDLITERLRSLLKKVSCSYGIITSYETGWEAEVDEANDKMKAYAKALDAVIIAKIVR